MRRQIIQASNLLVKNRMNRGSSGNISLRADNESFLITPSAVPANDMSLESICHMSMDGKCENSPYRPSSEWRIHRDVYLKRPDVHAVIHTHSPFATTLACLEKEIPPFHYMIALVGGNTIHCAPYALFGTQQLSELTIQSLGNQYAVLMSHHGMLAVGKNLDHAMSVAIEVESLCEQYWRILQIGPAKILSTEQMLAVHEKFKDYKTINTE